jgi:hypothetical protein
VKKEFPKDFLKFIESKILHKFAINISLFVIDNFIQIIQTDDSKNIDY